MKSFLSFIDDEEKLWNVINGILMKLCDEKQISWEKLAPEELAKVNFIAFV